MSAFVLLELGIISMFLDSKFLMYLTYFSNSNVSLYNKVPSKSLNIIIFEIIKYDCEFICLNLDINN